MMITNDCHHYNHYFHMTMIILKIQAAKSGAAEAPLVLWLQGGPGWSSAFGAFKEVDKDHDHQWHYDHDHDSPGWPSVFGAFKEVDKDHGHQ